jgi:hypothetical protein
MSLWTLLVPTLICAHDEHLLGEEGILIIHWRSGRPGRWLGKDDPQTPYSSKSV